MKNLVMTLIVAIIFLVALLAFFIGRSFNTDKSSQTSTTAVVNETEALITPTPAPTIAQTKKVTGGGILSFPKYELTTPADWEVTKEIQGEDSEKVILKKDAYELSILEGGFGGAVCLYPGDPDSEGPSGRYEEFVEITTKSGDLLRRSWTGTGGFAICHKTQYGWNAPTLFGHISIKTPTSYTTQMIEEIDQILASFTRI